MLLNTIPLVDRYNRPSVQQKVAIRAFFLDDGQFTDPYDVSACTIFSKYANTAPSSIVDAGTGLIKPAQPVTSILMNFGISGSDTAIHDGLDPGEGLPVRVTENFLNDAAWFPPYVPGPQASGIYRVSSGDYVAVLDGGVELSGGYNIHYPYEEGITVENSASTVGDYIDVWTVKMSAGSEYQLFINTFQLFNDTFISITEPLILTTNNRLVNKHVSLGSQVNLMVTTELTLKLNSYDITK